MTLPHFQLLFDLNRAHAVISRQFDARLGAVHGIALTELQLLWVLAKAPEQRLRRMELAEQLGVTPSGVTWMLRPLTKRRLVTTRPDPADARASFALLTEAGARLVAEALPTARHLAAEMLSPQVRGHDVSSLADLLGRLGARRSGKGE
jgi:DNA-binding MarR family transcriptional regulator